MMKIDVVLKRRDGKADAKGEYFEGKLTVKKGSLINLGSVSELRLPGFIQEMRNDKTLVDKNGFMLKDETFKSASTAGTFVTGTSTNGLRSWRTMDGKRLSAIIKK